MNRLRFCVPFDLPVCIKTLPRGDTVHEQHHQLGGQNIMIRHKVEICGVDTSKLPVLKNDEMRKLFVKLQEGKESAREELVNGNLRIVLSVIKRFNNRGEYVDDLFQVGCIGLMKSIDNFNLSQYVIFYTYALNIIIVEIRIY